MYLDFVIPNNKDDLLMSSENYTVTELVDIQALPSALKDARESLKNEGIEAISEQFDVYFSVLYHIDSTSFDLVLTTYQDLHNALGTLNKTLGFLLEDKDNVGDENKLTLSNIMKMLLYLYSNLSIAIEKKVESHNSQNLNYDGKKGRKKSQKDALEGIDQKQTLCILNCVIQKDLSFFFDPPFVDEKLISAVADVAYRVAENSSLRSRKEINTELFHLIGTLITNYNHGMGFILRMSQLIKLYEHLVPCLAEGINILVKRFSCRSIVHDFIMEIMDNQTDEKFEDSQGSKNCAAILVELVLLMPNLMLEEIEHLKEYLNTDSYPLRNSVLHILTEILLKVLTKPEQTDAEKKVRDDFLFILEERTGDITGYVRSKVFQHFTALHMENAIPVSNQLSILKKAIMHLQDKASNVRKSAIKCVTTFLSHNIYGSTLILSEVQQKLTQTTEQLFQILGNQFKKFDSIAEDVREAIKNFFKNNENPSLTSNEGSIDENTLGSTVYNYLNAGQYSEAISLCYRVGLALDKRKMKEITSEQTDKVAFYFDAIKKIFTTLGWEKELLTLNSDERQHIDDLKKQKDYYENTIAFLTIINEAIDPMLELLESVNITDMQEAIEFFITAYSFQIGNAFKGVLGMLKMIQKSEQEYKEAGINGLKKIYLITDSKNLPEHTTIIVERLIDFLKVIPYSNLHNVRSLISEWVSKGDLDNAVIDKLWKYFTNKENVNEEKRRAALQLLGFAGCGRRTIIERNVKLITSVVFVDGGVNCNILLAKTACDALQAIGSGKQSITDKNPPFRIKVDDEIWTDLIQLLINKFYDNSSFYNCLASSAIAFIYQACSMPAKLCENLIRQISIRLGVLESMGIKNVKAEHLAQFIHILGEVALKQLIFLDETIYKELKRRNYIREETQNKGKDSRNNRSVTSKASASKRFSSVGVDVSAINLNDSNVDDSTLEGAQATDSDSEFIIGVLENGTVTRSVGLGRYANTIITVVKKPNVYDDCYLQGVAVNALLRYMLVSSVFCNENMQLIFTVLEKTQYNDVKCSILMHFSDLLERFPNIAEPWTPKIYDRLNDSDEAVRVTTFFILSNLLLRDMMRANVGIPEMAKKIVDTNETIKEMAMGFFTQLANKGNNLFNILPVIFSNFVEHSDIKEEDLRFVMKYLFGLIQKNKHWEGLVDRFCSKFRLVDDEYQIRNIAYCLSLIQYNEKAIKQLVNNFELYKNHLHVEELYTTLKHLSSSLAKSAKDAFKASALELEEKINQHFEENMDQSATNDSSRQRPPGNTPTFKKPRGKPPKKRAGRKRVKLSIDEDMDVDDAE